MEESKGEVVPCRLFDAAEVVLRLAGQKSGVNGVLSYAYPAGTPVLAHRLSQFSYTEIQEACDFLVRLGFLEDPDCKGAATPPPPPAARRRAKLL